jgi:hypothetical protein
MDSRHTTYAPGPGVMDPPGVLLRLRLGLPPNLSRGDASRPCECKRTAGNLVGGGVMTGSSDRANE